MNPKLGHTETDKSSSLDWKHWVRSWGCRHCHHVLSLLCDGFRYDNCFLVMGVQMSYMALHGHRTEMMLERLRSLLQVPAGVEAAVADRVVARDMARHSLLLVVGI